MLTAHVLAMDPASWRIVLGELDAGLHALAAGRAPSPARENTSYRQWSRLLAQRAKALDSVDFWVAELEGADPPLGARRVAPQTDRVGELAITMSISDADLTARLLSTGRSMTDLLATAAARMVTAWRRQRGQQTPAPLLALETHGRADVHVDKTADTSDTVGLLSAIYPLRIHCDGATDFARIPGSGIDYGLLRYLRADTAERLRAHREPQLLLNYLGSLHVGVGDLAVDRALLADVGQLPEPEQPVRHELTVLAALLRARRRSRASHAVAHAARHPVRRRRRHAAITVAGRAGGDNSMNPTLAVLGAGAKAVAVAAKASVLRDMGSTCPT